MRLIGLSVLFLALWSVPIADACFLKRCCIGDKRSAEQVKVSTVTITYIDGEAPVFDYVAMHWKISHPVPANKIFSIDATTNFPTAGLARTWNEAYSCPESKPNVAETAVSDKEVKSLIQTGVGHYDAIHRDHAAVGPNCTCTVRLIVGTYASDTIHYKTGP